MSFLLESVLGVPVKYSSIDFEMTSFSSEVGTRKRSDSNLYRDCLNFLNTMPGATMQEKAAYYLISIGISPEDIEALRNIVLE